MAVSGALHPIMIGKAQTGGEPDPSGNRLLRAMAAASVDDVYRQMKTAPGGLSRREAARRLRSFGPNAAGETGQPTLLARAREKLKNPLNLLLLALAGLSWLVSDLRSALLIAIMVFLSIGLSFLQEHRSGAAAARLAAMVRVEVKVRRQGTPGADAEGFVRIPIDRLVPGDIIGLSAGDIVPADVRLCSAHDLHVNQSTLTGESMPAEKSAAPAAAADGDLLGLPDMCYMGSSISTGFGTAVVICTGPATAFGALARAVTAADTETAFDRGIRNYSWLMVRFIAVMVPVVFLINGLTKHDWLEAMLFAAAVATGLAPEMLPMIVTVNLAQGAIAMSGKQVIVKRLDAIQNLGAMDVLCADKTGTLTQDRVVLKLHLDTTGGNDDRVLQYAYLNSHFQSGLQNLLDLAIRQHAELEDHLSVQGGYRKLDEIPFDFDRRRLSVVIETPDRKVLLICKGAIEEVLAVSATCRTPDGLRRLDRAERERVKAVTGRLHQDGFRVIALATREEERARSAYAASDEADLTLQGFVAFLDPPKETAAPALAALAASGVAIKILTGDNDLVTRKTCRDVGLAVLGVVTGPEIDAMDDAALGQALDRANVFARVSPGQKARIIAGLQARDHVVGFLGDGINDGPALKRADVGISVDTAADIARESADIILLAKDLAILGEGVVQGRRVFGNIIKYVRMSASSSFGNMFSVLGASLFLPFLPMTPLQVLANNLLYDFSQTAIPTDTVDRAYLDKPRTWEIGNVLRFMLVMGPISSLFDYATYAAMIRLFGAFGNPPLFQTGWFVESALSQTLIIHIIRTAGRPFIDSRASLPLVLSTGLICLVAIALPSSPLAGTLGFHPLPGLYWPVLSAILAAYGALAYLASRWFFRRWGV